MERRELLKLNKIEIRKRCKECQLPTCTNGNKGDLVDRLMDNSNKTKRKQLNTVKKIKPKHKKQAASMIVLNAKIKQKSVTKLNKKKSAKKSTKKRKKIKKKTVKPKYEKHVKSMIAFNVKDSIKTKSKKSNKKDQDIINQLIRFNYNKQDIVDAMDNVIDRNDINGIIHYLDDKIREENEIKQENDSEDDDSSLSILSIETFDDNDTMNSNHDESDDDSSVAETIISALSMAEKPRKHKLKIDIFSNNEDDDTLHLLSPKHTPRIPNKFEIAKELKSMNFSMDRILRAFKVYEKNYGEKYNISGLIELIQRLKIKDKENNKVTEEKLNMTVYDSAVFCHSSKLKHNKGDISLQSFVAHMTMQEADELLLFDNIDHRDFTGKFCVATIIDIDVENESNLKIHYEDDFDDKYDIWCDYKLQLFRFASYRSISRRKQCLFNDELEIGHHVNINPHQYYLNGLAKTTKWIEGVVTAFDKKSAQIQILHQNKIKIDSFHSFNSFKWYIYWTHIDNIHEMKQYSPKSIFPSTFYKYNKHKKQSI